MKKLLLLFFCCLLNICVLSMDEESRTNQSGTKRKKNETFFCNLCNDSLKSDEEISLQFHLENSHFICTKCNQQYSSGKDVRSHFFEEHATSDMIQPMKKRHRKN